jgi:ribosome biogenesis protein SSF1/2
LRMIRKLKTSRNVSINASNFSLAFIVRRGKIGQSLKELLHDTRNLMYPYTAIRLKEQKKNTIKDFLGAAGQYGVSHMMMYTQTEQGNYLRLIKNPKGPTLTFRIDEFALSRDVVSFIKANKRHSKIFDTTMQAAPLLIMNGFSSKAENDPLKIASLMIQSMFPPIKVQNMNLSSCKRIVLFNLVNKDGKEFIEFRHYGVSARQRAVNRGIKKLVNNHKVPNLAKFNDVADFVLRNQRMNISDMGAYSSESEIEDLPGSKIVLPDDYQDKKKNTSVAIRLHELGPRLKLSLIKIVEGFCRGNVVYHALQTRTPAEIRQQIDSIKSKKELKEKRKKI